MKRSLILCLILSLCIVPAALRAEKNRIAVEQVNFSNYKEFMEQIEQDLPVGTSLKDVEEYLSKHQLPHSYVPEEKRFYVMIKDIDSSFFVFNTDLSIKIYASDKKGLSDIASELIETAF